MRLSVLTGVALALLVFTAHADPQGKWWADPVTGTFSMVDPDSHVQVSGCSTVQALAPAVE